MSNFNEDRIRLLDIADSIREIQGYIDRDDFGTFSLNDYERGEVFMQLSQIGGAAALLSDEFKEKYGDVDWDMLKGLQYSNFDQTLEMDLHPMWHIVTEDLPNIMDQILDLAAVLGEDDLRDVTLNEEDLRDVQDYQFKKELEVRGEASDVDAENEIGPARKDTDGMGRDSVRDTSAIDKRFTNKDVTDQSSLGEEIGNN